MSNRFDFEQQIMQCWAITEDINTLYTHVMDQTQEGIDIDKVSNILLGISQLYELKFQTLFQMFEDQIRTSE